MLNCFLTSKDEEEIDDSGISTDRFPIGLKEAFIFQMLETLFEAEGV